MCTVLTNLCSYNQALGTSGSMNELMSVQLVCGLFATLNNETDAVWPKDCCARPEAVLVVLQETKTRLLAALAHTLFCNVYATEAAANFGWVNSQAIVS